MTCSVFFQCMLLLYSLSLPADAQECTAGSSASACQDAKASASLVLLQHSVSEGTADIEEFDPESGSQGGNAEAKDEKAQSATVQVLVDKDAEGSEDSAVKDQPATDLQEMQEESEVKDQPGFETKEPQKEENLLQSASGDAPPFVKGICQPSGIQTPNECCPNGYESILNLELCIKAVVKLGPQFDPIIKKGPHTGKHMPVVTTRIAMHIEGTTRPQLNQWVGGRLLRSGEEGYNKTWLPTAGKGCGIWTLNHAPIFTPYDQVGKEVNGVIWPLCVISTYPKDEMPEFAISHCRPSGRYTKNECCDYGYLEITDAETCKRSISQFPWDCGSNCGIRPAEWMGEREDDDYPFGCYIRNDHRARTYNARHPLQGFLNTKTPQGDMVSGLHAAATVCRRLDYGFEGDYYAPRNPEAPSDSKADFVICTIKQAGTVVNVDCPGISSMNQKTGTITEPKLMSIEGMTARRFGKALRFSNGWVWAQKTNDAALEDSR